MISFKSNKARSQKILPFLDKREHRCATPIFLSLVLGVTSAWIDSAAFGVLSVATMFVASNVVFVATDQKIALVSYCVCSKKIDISQLTW